MPARTTATRQGAERRHATGAALGLAVVLAVAGCASPAPSGGATADGLLALTAGADRPSLVGWRNADPRGIPVDLPHGDTTWISVGRANVLAATVGDAGLATSDPLHLGEALVWRFVDAEDASGSAPPDQGFFATWDPAGGIVAELVGDLASGAGISVIRIDPSVGTALAIPIDRQVVAAPPAWVAADRLILVTGDATTPTAALVDTSTGVISDGPGGARLVATSANLDRVATMAGPGEPIVIRDLGGWLAGETATLGSVEPPDGVSTAVAIALDTSGQRLAVAWSTAARAVELAVYDGRSGWRRTAEPTLKATRGAAIAWQR
jgi:hypothetical protein